MYTVVITKVETGETRKHVEERDWPTDDPDENELFWWTDGNIGCDCSLAHLFAQAAGEPQPEQDCGESAYRIERIELPDGRVIKVQED